MLGPVGMLVHATNDIASSGDSLNSLCMATTY